MTTRRVVIGVVLGFTLFFAYLTVYAAVDRGFTILSVVSIAVLALFTIALLGMLSQPPDDD